MRDYPLVSPKFEREPDNAPGPFYVIKDQCVLCALPPALAPANITWSQETLQRRCGETCPTHCRVEKQPETADELALVIEAARCSCIAAIRYCGTDPEILARFRAEGLESLCDALWPLVQRDVVLDEASRRATVTVDAMCSHDRPLDSLLDSLRLRLISRALGWEVQVTGIR